MKPPLFLIDCWNKQILEQLRLEEALLRTDTRAVCLINRGSPRALVMGLSGSVEELVNLPQAREKNVPIIRRFSGGGSVVVDHETLFISFLFPRTALPIPAFPEPILRWGASLYREAWQIDGFDLIENDFVIGIHKCGGNAQYIQKNRWLLHTSFLWGFETENMNLLLLPPKRPVYRRDRPHDTFLCRLKNHAPTIEHLIDRIKSHLSTLFELAPFPEEELAHILARKHRQETHRVVLV